MKILQQVVKQIVGLEYSEEREKVEKWRELLYRGYFGRDWQEIVKMIERGREIGKKKKDVVREVMLWGDRDRLKREESDRLVSVQWEKKW